MTTTPPAHPFGRRSLLVGALGLGAVGLGATGALGLPSWPAAQAAGVSGFATREVWDAAYEKLNFQVVDNEGGQLAWGASYLMLGIMRMYEAYRDPIYLDHFVEVADQVLAQTDEVRGVTDHAGRSGPVWRTGGSYTAGAAVITDAAGAELFEVRYAWSNATAATVEVRAGDQGRFTVVLRHPSTTVTLADVTLDPSSPDYVVTKINKEAYHPNRRWTAKDLRTNPTDDVVPATGVKPFAQRYYTFAVHTGMINYPLALFARIVLADKQLAGSRYRVRAQRYYSVARRGVAHHDHEFHYWKNAAGETVGDYVWPKGAPVPFDGLIQPYNQSQGLGQTMAELHRIRPNAEYARKVKAMVTVFRADMLTDADGTWQWHYWPTHSEIYNSYTAEADKSEYTPWFGTSQQWEDISHAAISVEFMAAAYGAGLGATADDVARLGQTYLQNVAIDGSTAAQTVEGVAPASASVAPQAARWGAVEPYAAGIGAHAEAVFEAISLTPSQGSHLLSLAYLNWISRRAWQ